MAEASALRLEQHRTLWDVALPFDEAVPKLAALGYDGIEVPFKNVLELGPAKVRAALEAHGLRLSLLIFTDGPGVPGDPNGAFLWGGPYEGYSAPATDAELAAAMEEEDEAMPGEKPGQGAYPGFLPPEQARVVAAHTAVFQEQVARAYELFGRRGEKDEKSGKVGLLTLVNCHTLRDCFSEKMAARFFETVLPWEHANRFLVTHETHRKRFLYSPWRTRDFLRARPQIRAQLRMCADLSHWAAVAESDPEDPVLNAAVAFIAPNVRHVHARVGHSQGSQVVDPRLPASAGQLAAHEKWWDLIWERAAAAADGGGVATMIAEHGPPPYQPCGRDGEPLADTWRVNHWVSLRRQTRFAELYGAERTSRLKGTLEEYAQ